MTTMSPEWEEATARSALYSFLSRSLALPTAAQRETLLGAVTPLVDLIELGDGELDRLLTTAIAEQRAAGDDLRRVHQGVFTHIESQDCPPYETAFEQRDVFRQTAVMADVAGFYRAHGLKVGGVERERPDHIGTEMEFMAFMARKEAYALDHLGPEEVEECRRTQAHFLRDHLGRWAPAFGLRMSGVTDHPVFVAVGLLLAAWIQADMESWGVLPSEQLSEPQPMGPPDDGSCAADDATGHEVAESVPVTIGERHQR
jgi:TorA maturation chaperone TorD